MSAQLTKDLPNNTYLLSIGNGTQVYSDDVFFNKYLSNSTPTGNDYNVKIEKKRGHKLIVSIEKDTTSLHFDLTKDLKNAAVKKRKREIAALQKELKQFEKQKSNSKHVSINLPYSSIFFQSSHRGNWNYVFPNNNPQKFAPVLFKYAYLETASLQHLYTAISIVYNSKIINHCLSIIYRLRPPPPSI